MELPMILDDWAEAWRAKARSHEDDPENADALASCRQMSEDLLKLYDYARTLESFKKSKQAAIQSPATLTPGEAAEADRLLGETSSPPLAFAPKKSKK